MEGCCCFANTLSCISLSSKTLEPASSELDGQTRFTSHVKNVCHDGDMGYMTQAENGRLGFNYQVREGLPKEDHGTQGCVSCENEDNDFNITNMEIMVQKAQANKYRQALYDAENTLRIYQHDAYSRYEDDSYTTTSSTLRSNLDTANFDKFKTTVQNVDFGFVLEHYQSGHHYKRQSGKTHCCYDNLKTSVNTLIFDLDYTGSNFQHISTDIIVMPSWQIARGRDIHNESRQDQTELLGTEVADEGQYAASNLALQTSFFEVSSGQAKCSPSLNDNPLLETRGQIFDNVDGQHSCDGQTSIRKHQIFCPDDPSMNYWPLLAVGIQQTEIRNLSAYKIQQTDNNKLPADKIQQTDDRMLLADGIQQTVISNLPADKIDQADDRMLLANGIQQTVGRKLSADAILQTDEKWLPVDEIQNLEDRQLPDIEQTNGTFLPADGRQHVGDTDVPADGKQQHNATLLPANETFRDGYTLLPKNINKQTYDTCILAGDMKQIGDSLLPAVGMQQMDYTLSPVDDIQQNTDKMLSTDGIQINTAMLLPADATQQTKDSLLPAAGIQEADDKQITGFIQQLHSKVFQKLNYLDDPQTDDGSIKLPNSSGDQHTNIKHLLPDDIQQPHSPVYEKTWPLLSEDIPQLDISTNDQHIYSNRQLLTGGFQQPYSTDDKEPDCRFWSVLESQKSVYLGKDRKTDVENGPHLVSIKDQHVEINTSTCIDRQRFLSNNQQDYFSLQQLLSSEDPALHVTTEESATDQPWSTYVNAQPVYLTSEHERQVNTSDNQNHISKQLSPVYNQQRVCPEEALASKRKNSQIACEIQKRLTQNDHPMRKRSNALTPNSESSYLLANEDFTDNENIGQSPLSNSDRGSNSFLKVDSQRPPSTLCLSHYGRSKSSSEHRQSEKIVIHVSDISESESEVKESTPQGLISNWRTLSYMQGIVPDSDSDSGENITVPCISDFLNHSNTAVRPNITQNCFVTMPQTAKGDQMDSFKAGKVQESIGFDQKEKIDKFQSANVSSYLSQSDSSTTNVHLTFAFDNQSMLSSKIKQDQLALQRLESEHKDCRDLLKQSSDFSAWVTNDCYDGHCDKPQEGLNDTDSADHEYYTTKQMPVSSSTASVDEVVNVYMNSDKQAVSHYLPGVESFLSHGSERAFDSSYIYLNNQASTKGSYRPCCLSPPVFSSSEDEDLYQELNASVSDKLIQLPLVDEDIKKNSCLRHPAVYTTPFENLYHVSSSERKIFSTYGACQNGSRVAEDQDHISGKERENVSDQKYTETKSSHFTKSCLGDIKAQLSDSLVNEKQSNFSKHLNFLKSIADSEDIKTIKLTREETCGSGLRNENLNYSKLDSSTSTRKEKYLDNSSSLQKILSIANDHEQSKKIDRPNLSKAHSHKNMPVLKHIMPPCHVHLINIHPFIKKSRVCLSKLKAESLKKLGLYCKNEKLFSLCNNLGVPQDKAPTKHVVTTPELLMVTARLKQIRNQNRQKRMEKVQENLIKISQALKKPSAGVLESVVHHKCAGKEPLEDITNPEGEASLKSSETLAENKFDLDSHILPGNCFSSDSEFLSNVIENKSKNQSNISTQPGEGTDINSRGKSQQTECKAKGGKADTSPKSTEKKLKKKLSKKLKPFENSSIKDPMSPCSQTLNSTSLETKFLADVAQCKTESRKRTKENRQTDSLDKRQANFDQQDNHVKNKKQKSSFKIERAHHDKPKKKNFLKTEEECGNSKIIDKDYNYSKATRAEKIETSNHHSKIKTRKECGDEKLKTRTDQKSKTALSQDKVINKEAETGKICPAALLSGENIESKSIVKKISMQNSSPSVKNKFKKMTKFLSGSGLCDKHLKRNPVQVSSVHHIFSASSFKIPKKSSSSSNMHSSNTANSNPVKPRICPDNKSQHDQMSKHAKKRDRRVNNKHKTAFQKSSKSSQDHARMSPASSAGKANRFPLINVPKCLSLSCTDRVAEGEANSSSVYAQCERGIDITKSEQFVGDRGAAALKLLRDKSAKVLASKSVLNDCRDRKNLTSDKPRKANTTYSQEDILSDVSDCHTSQAAGGKRNESLQEYKVSG